jgi:hypothetical protein
VKPRIKPAMFVAAPDEVAGDADLKRTIAAIGHYVNKAATHHTNEQDVDGLASRACPTCELNDGTSPAVTLMKHITKVL